MKSKFKTKQILAIVLVTFMLITSLPFQAFAQVNYEKLTDDKVKFVNELKPVKPVKTNNAAEFIKNPDQPAIYTLRYDFKVPVESRYKISYQPYIASVGANAIQAEKDKVKKIIPMPKIAGYTPPDDEEDFTITYNDIVDKAKKSIKTEDKLNGDRYNANQDFKYEPVSKTIQVKDVFQDVNDFNNYVSMPEHRTRNVPGSTGSALQVSSLQDSDIKGFVPEASYITVQLPDKTDGYEVEYRYNRAHYDVTFDTDGGTPVQAREFYYGQKITALDASELPTKNGFKLAGWTATPILKDASGTTHSAGNLQANLSGDLIMPAEPVKFKAVWTADPSASATNPSTKQSYNVSLDYDNGNTKNSTVNHGDKFTKPRDPNRKGYTFMGWAWLDKNPDGKVLYSFNNTVTSDIKLKALWVKNDRVDLDIYHYFLDKDGNKDSSKSENPLKETLYDKRVGNFSTTVGDQISDKYTLASPEEIQNSNSQEIKDAYKNYNDKYHSNNSFFQTIMVEANNSNGANTFYFIYRPFRKRVYKVNYIDERFKNDPENGAIIPQELVENGNRDYDARNYRPIPGWKLVSAPQQQLFFDVDETTNKFLGINGTGKDEITFYYKDVRVIEVSDKNDSVPDGYARVTFKADEGGSFTDKDGNSKTELYYDVIKGLKSDLIPIPGNPTEDSNKEEGKYYIKPDNGRSFKEWKGLLNANTIIQEDYTFTATFDWSGLAAKDMVITEAYKDPNGTWTNDFAPKLADLRNQIVWMDSGQEKALPADAIVKYFDADDTNNENDLTNDTLFEKLNEHGVADKDETFRLVKLKTLVEFKNNINKKEVEFSIKVYKNRYEALTSGGKPLFLSDAEKNELKDILSDTAEKRYIKVTVNPSNKPDSKDSKIYYVNPKAWVDIPEINLSDADKAKLKFLNWTSDDVTKNDNGQANGVYDFAKRFKFTKDTIIYPVSAEDVVEQKGNDKPNVPDSFVKVIVKTTDNATTETAFERTFWVDPLNKVEIKVTNPSGKSDQEVDITGLGKKKVNYIFKEWQKVQTGETDESLTKVNPAVKIDLAKNKYTDKVTVVEAAYYERFAATPIIKPIKIDKLDSPEGKEITDKDLIDKITPPENKEIESITVIEKPDPSKAGKQEAKVIIKYKDGSTQGSNDNSVIVPVEVHNNVIPSYDGNMPEGALKNYVKITFKAGEGGTITDGKKKAYYVSPEVEVDMTSIAEEITKTPNTGYIKDKWDKELKGKFKNNTEFTFNFTKTADIVEKTNDSVEKPKDYVEVIFQTDGHGKLDGTKDKITYYVNPTAGVKIVNGTAGENQIAVPTIKANANYEFDKWYEELDFNNSITADRNYVANFKLVMVTLTYDANGATGQGPSAKTVKYGTKEFLANQEGLTKENYTFLGWKLDTDTTDKIYKPGEDIVLTANTKATAQWKIIQHTVSFNTMGGSDIASEDVDHGSTATKPENPTKAGFVFMGWKENENDQAYYDFNTEITADKTLVAIWEKAVQEINENDEVGEEFIKVKFEQGKHGSLEGNTIYKVGKDLSFAEAVEYGLVVPTIKPNEYYKAQEANAGWDKPLVLNKEDITFTAQYEIEGNVIPIDPNKTDQDIERERPEDMILVIFEVDPTKAFMTGITKFYVQRDALVNIDTPVVHPLTFDDKYNDYVFRGWSINTEDENNKVSFKIDTKINDSIKERPFIMIRSPKRNSMYVMITELTDGATAYLEITRGGLEPTIVEFSKQDNMDMFKIPDNLGGKLNRNDRLKVYSIKDGIESDIREYRIR